MKIYGLQKMTLLDFPGCVACTVFLSGCDFRCPYCHNYDLAAGTQPPVMEAEELFDFLKKRQGLIDGVAITGGEPCLHKGLPELVGEIHRLGYRIKLDTNGCHPAMLKQLLDSGMVEYVAMDVKNCAEKYPLTCGVEKVEIGKIRESIHLLMSGNTEYEFRTTVVKELHGEAELRGIGEMIRGAKRYFLQQFTDRESVPFGNLSAPSREEMQRYEKIMKEYVAETHLRGVD